MARQSVKVSGYREFMRAVSKAEKSVRKDVRAALRETAEPVRTEATAMFSITDARSAAGFRVAVRQRGVAVEQRYGRTTGKHPEFGRKQMRVLRAALAANASHIEHGVEKAIDKIADRLEGKGAAI
jgi:hypothetical protein